MEIYINIIEPMNFFWIREPTPFRTNGGLLNQHEYIFIIFCFKLNMNIVQWTIFEPLNIVSNTWNFLFKILDLSIFWIIKSILF
jgi:hypothetical protein